MCEGLGSIPCTTDDDDDDDDDDPTQKDFCRNDFMIRFIISEMPSNSPARPQHGAR